MKDREAIVAHIREMFTFADTSGDGVIVREEFEAMISDENAMALFHNLDLDRDEVEALFDILARDDGEVDYEELLGAAFTLKTSARRMDMIQLQATLLKVTRGI